MRKNCYRPLLLGYVFITGALFLYSFTQIDLNLTLSRISVWQSMQKKFMYIGYFKRPLSTAIYLSIIAGLFSLYIYTLTQAFRQKITTAGLWKIIFITAAVLFLSYPAFSHDIFNYMFSAKTMVEYGRLYFKAKPLDFLGDPWLNFMRWTHRPGTYPPLWVLTTLPFYYFGFGKLIPIILNFKAIVLVSYLGSIYIIGKIMEIINYKYKKAAIAFFALNPLVVVESLVSAHNDIVMAFWALLGFYVLYKNKRIFSLLLFSISVGMKGVSIFLLPLVILGPRRFIAFLFMLIGLIVLITQIEIQPWYFVWVLAFASLNIDRSWVIYPAVGLSLGLLLRYVPFLYIGNWNPPVTEYKLWLTVLPLAISVIILAKRLQKNSKKKLRDLKI